MARPKSDQKRSAILAAASRVIDRQGLGAPTALIAKEAGIATGSLFTYFATKGDLFNHLYVELKEDMASAAMEGLPARADIRAQFFHAWSNWMRWSAAHPEHWRVLAQLGVSAELTPATRAAGHQTMSAIAELMQRARAKGPMRGVPIAFVGALMNAMAEATMSFMVQDPLHAEKHCKVGFEALWRALS